MVHPPKTILKQIKKVLANFSRVRKIIGIRGIGKLGKSCVFQCMKEEQASDLSKIFVTHSLPNFGGTLEHKIHC